MSKVELAKIKSLTFYKDALTTARRTAPMEQLVCVGKPCGLFQPEVVRCTSLGGVGTEVDWKCEADLPDSLRFGKVEVSCEGWSKPGDPYVLKGSCSLEYRLLQVPGSLRDTDSPLFKSDSFSWPSTLFTLLWLAVLGFILYSFYLSCTGNNTTTRTARQPGHNPRPGGGSGWFPGDYHDDPTAPPPPYSKTNPQQQQAGWQPGFWTGAALGGVASHLYNRPRTDPARTSSYDWERSRLRQQPQTPSFFGRGGGHRSTSYQSDDRGEGSSNLGPMRRSTGLGGSNVR